MDLSAIEAKMAERDWQAAADASRELLRSQPVNAKLHGYLGWSLMQIGDFAAAVDSLKRAVNLEPRLLPAGRCLAQSLVQQNRYQEAWDIVTEYLKQAPNDRMLIGLRDFLHERVKHRGERWEINQRVEAKVRMAGDDD